MGYKGRIAEIPLGAEGLTGSTYLAGLRPGQLLAARNVAYTDGAISKEGGALEYTKPGHTLTGVTIIGGREWAPIGGTRIIVYGSNGRLYRDTGTGLFSTILKTGLSGDCVPVWAEGGRESGPGDPRKLFMANGANPIQVLTGDGVVTTNILTPASDWTALHPRTICIHDGRLWAAASHRVYWSSDINHENFVTAPAGFMNVFPGAGSEEAIVQIMSYKHLLVIWKRPRGIFVIDTRGADETLWSVSQISGSIGGTSPQGAVAIENDILFVDSDMDIHLLSGIQEFGQLGTKNLSQLHGFNEFVRTRLNLTRKHKTRVTYYAAKREVHIAVTPRSLLVNHARIVVDFNRLDLPRFRWSPRDQCEGIWMYRDDDAIQKPMVGETGKIYVLDQDTTSKDGKGYPSVFLTPALDFSHVDPTLAGRRKNAQFLELTVNSVGLWTMNVDVIWDGIKAHTAHFNMSIEGIIILGTWVLGQHALGGRLIQSQQRRIFGSGRRLQLNFVNEGSVENFSLSSAFIYFQASDQSMR